MPVWYITTAIDYANGSPHIGHALEKIGADALARYQRLRGQDVHFVIGMDEHGLNVLQSAEAAGISPQQWVDGIADQFLDAWRRLAISHDDFIRTTESRHRRAVYAMIERMQASGDLYRGKYSGFYCVGCEAYKSTDELVPAPGVEPEEGKPRGSDPDAWRCPLHLTRALTWMEEENWFFRLSRYQQPLLDALDERPELVQPEIRRNEIRRVLEGGLEDLSVSRARLPWGVPWPGDPEHTVYVWIDALTNYLSATGFPDAGYTQYWPANVHVIGKDITRFHCIYWPAMLMSAGIELPRMVWAHGFLSHEGRKLSKSAGVWVDLDEAIARYTPDALRYYLLSDVPWNGDGDFSWRRFDERYTSDLANDLGNLVNRTLSMIERYRNGVIPEADPTSLDQGGADVLDRYTAAMDANLLHQGAAAALDLAHEANRFVDARAPWTQARDPEQAEELDATLASLARALVYLAALLEPFLPVTMQGLAARLGLERVPRLGELGTISLAGRQAQRGEILFPKPER